MLEEQNINVVCAILSLFPESREWNRNNYKKYFEIYIDVPVDQLKRRSFKGLYEKADCRTIKNVVGIDIQFSPPSSPDMVINNDIDLESPQPVIDSILNKLPN